MSDIISVITSPFNLTTKLYDLVKKYRKKKKTENRFVNAFEIEIKTYLDILDKISNLSEKRIIPILESIGDTLTVQKMNELSEAISPMPIIYAELIEGFIRFAKACSEVSAIKGFMDDLEESNKVLYDFVSTMKNTYIGENRVSINGRYYRFFKTYQDEIFREVKIDDLEENLEELEGYIRKVKHYMDKTGLIKRHIRRRIIKNFRMLTKAAANMTVEKTVIIDLRVYSPEKLLPITVFIEEFLQ